MADSIAHLSCQELCQWVKSAPPPVQPNNDDDKLEHSLAEAIIEKLGIHDP